MITLYSAIFCLDIGGHYTIPSILWLAKYRSGEAKSRWRWPIDDSDFGFKIECDVVELEHFCESWFSYNWNWVINAITKFVHVLNYNHLQPVDFRFLADRIKYGVADRLALDILKNRQSFPGTREHAQLVATWYLEKNVTINNMQELLLRRLFPTPSELTDVILDKEGHSITQMSSEMAERICQWLEKYELDYDQDV